MAIERDPQIEFHELGTLTSVTRWITTHDEGLAEWLKNSRRAYQTDRANVQVSHRAAILLLRDQEREISARIGLLDVGGATLEDVTRWSVWQDPDASPRGSSLPEEQTQGNGGKAYMFKMFRGPATILGVRDGRKNHKGFEGPAGTVERGTPGFMPDNVSGRDLALATWEPALEQALAAYGLTFEELPDPVRVAIQQRQAFTLVEGIDPIGLYKGRIVAEELVHKLLRHDQSTLAVEQLRLFAAHNGRMLNDGKPLQLEPIPPHPGFEEPVVHEIPDSLPDDSGQAQSTTLGGLRPTGRLILYTSKDNMPGRYKELRPRWKITYRTQHQMVGSKAVGELAPTVPGNQFVYGTVELSSLEPDYVALGRVRPNDGPLMEAVDRFVADRIRDLAKEINDRRRHELDQEQLDEVHEENQRLDTFKNQFLPSSLAGNGGIGPKGIGGTGGGGGGGGGGERGEIPDSIELAWDSSETLRLGRAVRFHLHAVLQPVVRDAAGRAVPRATLEWHSSDRRVIQFVDGDLAEGQGKGLCEIWTRVSGTSIESPRIRVETWNVDHVLLSPRVLEIPLGRRKQIVAEVTNDDGHRATNVYLNWEHDAPDSLIVRIHPSGWVTGNRIGQTSVSAGAGDPLGGGIWARIRAEVVVVENPEELRRGGGFPRLLLTDRDIDPNTGEERKGDPEQPALWQEPSDYINNIWWLNLESPAALSFFARREDDPQLWRSFHSQKLVEMVIQVHMQEEFISKADERRDLWVGHKAAMERFEIQLAQPMWEKLNEYVLTGRGIE